MIRYLLVLIAVVAAPLAVLADGPTWTIYHSWDGGHSYTRRGVLEWKGEEGGLVLTNDENSLTKEQVAAMLDFGWYQIKIDTAEGDYVLATVPACSIRRANFKDDISVTLPRVGASDMQITSLAYTPLISALAPKTCDDYAELIPETIQWNSKVQATLDTPGMTLRAVLPKIKPPPGYSWLSHPNKNKGSAGGAPGGDPAGGGGGGSEEDPPKPFFIKYWYIILPLALANFIPFGDSAQPAAAVEGGASSGEAPAVAAAAGPAAAPAAGTGGSSKGGRRGKRA